MNVQLHCTYAKATNGVFFDTEGNEVWTAEKALEVARDLENQLPQLLGGKF